MRKPTILVVDDDEGLLKSLTLVLEDAGYDVVTANNGEKGLQALKETVPDLITLDIKMPTMSGLGLLRHICGTDGKPRYPVLVLTARSNMQGFFDNLDVDGFLLKPCRGDELLAEIKRILDEHGTVGQKAEIRKKRIRRTILIAEDEDAIRSDLVRAFNDAGYSAEGISNGSDAVGRAIELCPDAIIVKEVLSQMNGHSVAATVVAVPKTSDIPVIVYEDSGLRYTDEDREEFEARPGVFRFLPNSEPDELLKIVNRIFK